MEGLNEKFVVNLKDRELVIGKIDKGQKKIIHFTANEALILLSKLKNVEKRLFRITKEDTA